MTPMLDRVARVAALVTAAIERRPEASGPLAELARALQDDYGTQPTFTDLAAPLPDDDRFAALIDVFALDDASAALLQLAVAPDLDANVALAFDLLGGRTGAGWPSVGLAFELAGLPSGSKSAALALHQQGALRRFGLIRVRGDGPWLGRSLHAPDRIRTHLVGADAREPVVDDLVVDALPVGGPVAAELARAIEAGAGLVWLRAPFGTAGIATAAGACAELEIGALVVDVHRAGRPPLGEVLGAAVLEAALRAAALVVAGADRLFGDDASRDFAMLEAAAVPVIAVGTKWWPAGVLATIPPSADAPLLTAADRQRVWVDVLGEPPADEPGHPALASLRLAPEEILATARFARARAAARDAALDTRLLRDAARAVGAGTAGGDQGVARPAASRTGFDDLLMPEYAVAELRRLVRWGAHRDEVLTRGAVHGKGGKGVGIAALFTGGPGTGKSLAAHVVADELNLDLLQVDLSTVIDKYIGETEKNLERIFREAERRDVVLFFDEADALFGSRSQVTDARDRYANQEVSYLLQRMEQFDGITVLATNLRGNLDQAFARRMQVVVHFPDPDAATRRRLWQRHLDEAGGVDPDEPPDLDHLAATHELSGGDIRNVVLAAAYDAVCDGLAINAGHVRAATARELQKLGRRVPKD